MQFRSKLVIVAIFVAVFAPLAALAQKEIFCRSSDARFDRPGDCAAQCDGEFETKLCALQPQTAALNDFIFLTYYNAVFFNNGNALQTRSCLGRQVDLNLGTSPQDSKGTSSGGDEGDELRSKLIKRIILAWYGGYEIGNFRIVWGRDEAKNIGIAVAPMQYGKFPLFLSVNLLCKSPAYMAASVGHELIHVEQYKRIYTGLNVDDLAIRKVRDALREVEAYEWETNSGAFPWKINTSDQWLGGFTATERSELDTLQQCAAWNVANEIEQLRKQPDAETSIKKLMVFFEQDPWVRSNWLPHHTDWAVRSAGPQPAPCQKPPFAAF